MSREKQRKNRREKNMRAKKALLDAFMRGEEPARGRKPWLNHEGYHDPTAYIAISNIE